MHVIHTLSKSYEVAMHDSAGQKCSYITVMAIHSMYINYACSLYTNACIDVCIYVYVYIHIVIYLYAIYTHMHTENTVALFLLGFTQKSAQIIVMST